MGIWLALLVESGWTKHLASGSCIIEMIFQIFQNSNWVLKIELFHNPEFSFTSMVGSPFSFCYI